MLTLGRKIGEAILIGDDIKIILTQINGNQAKISIVAPKHIKILREELAPHNARDNSKGSDG